jgi:hypothetical protein
MAYDDDWDPRDLEQETDYDEYPSLINAERKFAFRNLVYHMYKPKSNINNIINTWEELKRNEEDFLSEKNTRDVEFSSVEEYLLAYILKKEIANLKKRGYRSEKLILKLKDILFTLVTFIDVDTVKDITDLTINPGFINKINASRNDIKVDVGVISDIYNHTVIPNLKNVIENTIKVVSIVIGKARTKEGKSLPNLGHDVERKIAGYLGNRVISRFSRKPRKSVRKPRKSARKSRKSVRKLRKSARKPRKSARKLRKSARKPRKSAR